MKISNSRMMTQAQYDRQENLMRDIRYDLQDTVITPDHALDCLMDLGFGHDQAVLLVDEWGKGIYAPYAVWSKIKVEA